MASELDDNEGNRKKLRGAPAAAKNAELPHAQDEVTPEVARVVNLLQRLDKLHSKQPQNAPPPLPPADHTRAQSSKPKHGQSDSGGLSSLGDRYLDRAAPDRNGLRAVPSSPVAFSPPPLPPVRTASSDLPTVLKGLLPVGDEIPVHPAVLEPQAPALIEAVEPERARKHKRDDPPVVLIGAAIIGLVVVAGVGMYQFQQIPGAPRDQAVSNPTAGPVRAGA